MPVIYRQKFASSEFENKLSIINQNNLLNNWNEIRLRKIKVTPCLDNYCSVSVSDIQVCFFKHELR
jgi:hypothetical protein